MRSNNFVVLSISDFEIEGEFKLSEIKGPFDHCYIYSGYVDYCWLVGLDIHRNLCFWLGDGSGWNIFDNERLNFIADVGITYKLTITRRGDEIFFKINSRFVGSLKLPVNFYILGSHLGIGSIKGKFQSWNIAISYPSIGISDAKFSTLNNYAFRNRIHLLSMFYGEKHSRWLGKMMFPSLMLHSNLPSLQDSTISHHIYCSNNELPMLNNHLDSLEKSGIAPVINTQIIPAADDGRQRDHLFLAMIDAINSAILDNAVIVMAQADHVFGHGLANIINTMRPHEYVVCGHPRVNDFVAEEIIPQFLNKLKNAEIRSNRSFVSLAMSRLIHPMVNHGLNNLEPYWHGFESNKHFSIFFKEPPPLCFHPHPEMLSVILGDTFFGHFESLDHDLVDFSFKKNRLRIIDDSEEFFWVELTNENTYNPTIQNNYYSDAAKRLFHHELKWHKNY